MKSRKAFKTLPVTTGKKANNAVPVRIDHITVCRKIPLRVPVQFEFEMPEIPVDNLVDNLEKKEMELLDAIDHTVNRHVIRKVICEVAGLVPRSPVSDQPSVRVHRSEAGRKR